MKNSIKAILTATVTLTPQGKEVHSELTLLKDCRTEESFPLHGHMVTFPFPLVSYMCFSRRGILTGMCENIARVSNYTIGHISHIPYLSNRELYGKGILSQLRNVNIEGKYLKLFSQSDPI